MLPGEVHYTYHHAVAVNSLGLRGGEVAQTKGVERRILVLGDSLVYGQGVGDDETVPHYLERALRSAAGGDGAWRVINGGLRGYGTAQELALLDELAERIDPDVVVLVWYWNDLAEPPVERVAERLAPWEAVAFDLGAPFAGSARLRWRATQVLRKSALLMFLHDRFKARSGGNQEPTLKEPVAEAGFERLAAHLDRFVAAGALRGFRPLMAIVPESASLRRAHPTREMALRAASLAAASDLEVIDLHEPLAELAAAAGRAPIIPFDGHYLPNANRAMAETIAARILAQEGDAGR
jgi:lysophospholipase L1-like esterase